ncbi:MAG: hypothetical protein ACLTLQ_08875 [[Clostridium] scindens]
MQESLCPCFWRYRQPEVPADKGGELGITYTVIGEVTEDATFSYGNEKISLAEAERAWKETLEPVFPTNSGAEGQEEKIETGLYETSGITYLPTQP